MKKVSISDIARSLGVSKTLVSLVINNKGDEHGISRDTQERVRKKIKELNYQPDALARGFRTGKTKTIGLIVSDISNLFYSRIARRIEDYAWEHGYSVVICSTDEDIAKEEAQISMLLSRKIDGLIISSSQENAEVFNQLQASGIPHVLIDRTIPGMNSASVSVDNFEGARMAAGHLIDQGFERIRTFGITPGHISTINDRIRGFQSAFVEHGLEVRDECVIRVPFHAIDETIREQLYAMRDRGALPDAIFALNNNITSICLKYLRELRIPVPGKVALVGFDDMQHFDFTQPSVSTIKQPVDMIGKKAFDLLLQQIKGIAVPPNEWSVSLPVDLIIRESSVRQIEQ